ncbi:hypothetical protein PRIPAC_80614 [Pristionchus pacificus]|uniref:Mutator-like transposase domain-containing protein n=1 Tax=Pristionchus pacificus TaxID=54126 RepID=H3DVU7_PRIPA|nr:hypothetical protein PRIPAC_78078 [Pristionchus pacificus]KAF8374185.1 hypothetical protein PRIPAC_80614 [Pristionchus pacificus]|eukprot:PDM70386.1 hypothetical protein PRIPAC_46632 [Pristionchus pacificus]
MHDLPVSIPLSTVILHLRCTERVWCAYNAHSAQRCIGSLGIFRRGMSGLALYAPPLKRRRNYVKDSTRVILPICASHFKRSDYSSPFPDTMFLKSTAVPSYQNPSTVPPATVPSATVLSPILPSLAVFSPPLSPVIFFPTTSSSTPVRRPRIPIRPAMNQEIDDDDTWAPPPPTTDNEPDCDYLLVSKESLMNLLRQCTVCRRGKNNLSFRMDGLGFTCTRECNLCGMRSPWENSKPLRTANPSGKERLPKINVDVVAGSVLTAMGGTKLRQIMLMSGIHSLSMTTFHKIKKIYVAPAIDREFSKMQQGVIDALRRKIEQGEKVHLSGDGSYDTRGYSAHWCRYFLLNAETSEVLHHIIVHKSETGNSSSKMEVAALEKVLRELSDMVRGTDKIGSLVTDRHGAAIKMMKEKFQGIDHFFDPWHYFRNITLALLDICSAQYMMIVRGWLKTIIRRCYDAVISSNGNGEMASEKFRAILLCMQNQHDFTNVSNRFLVFAYQRVCAWAALRKLHFHTARWQNSTHSWRNNIKQFALEVRATMTETPYAKDKKRRAALAKKKREIDRQTRPIVPSRFDSNLEEERESEAEEEERESEDEEEERDSGEVDEDEIVLSPSDLLQQELIFVDDVNLEESDNEDENEEEDEE